MKARLLLLGVFLSLFISASQAQDASPTDELETAPPAASDSTSTLSLSEMFEDPDWVWYLATCVDLYLLEANSPLPAIDAYESPYTYFGSPEVRAVDLGLFWPWLDGNFPMDAANLAVTFGYWRSRAYASDETAWLEPAPESIATDPHLGYAGENEALSPSEPIGAPSAEPAEMETPPTASVDPFAGLSLSELFENLDWLSYLAYCVDLYLAQAGTVLSEDAYESPYAFFGSPEVQALTPGEIAVWLYENFAMDAANLAVTFDAWRTRAAYPAIDPAANEQAIDSSADVTTALGVTLDWSNRDPIGEDDGPNLYAYVRNRAVNFVDIDGRISWRFAGPGWEIHNKNNQWEYWKPDPDPASEACGKKCAQEVFGLETAIAMGLIGAGQPVLPKAPMLGASTGTSPAARVADEVFGDAKFPSNARPWAPTKNNPFARTRSVARFAGRWTPIVGWGITANDIRQFASCMDKCMGR